MKYLLQSNEFSWDSDTKRWTLRLTEKLRTNRALSLRNVAFQLRTDMVSPHCLLLCSNLAQISSKTIYQTAGDHRHTDILALLVENLPGRFVLRNPVNISVQNKDIAKIEFWVRTEAGDVVSCCVGDPLPGEVPVPTRGEVTSIPEMRLFMPMDINQNTAFETKSTIGESVRYLMNQKAGEEFLFNGYADFTLSTWGQHMGVSSTASWNYGIDGTNPNSLATDDFTIIFGTRTSTAILTTAEKVFNCRFFKLRFHNGLIKLLGAATNDFGGAEYQSERGTRLHYHNPPNAGRERQRHPPIQGECYRFERLLRTGRGPRRVDAQPQRPLGRCSVVVQRRKPALPKHFGHPRAVDHDGREWGRQRGYLRELDQKRVLRRNPGAGERKQLEFCD